MLCASGVLFLAEHTQQDRRWVMPMRLPDLTPPDAKETWNEAARRPDAEHLCLAFRLGRTAPPGITERLMASCYGFGRYHRFWKRGALIQMDKADYTDAMLLVELRTRHSAREGGAASAKVQHELNVEVRGVP